MDGGGWRLEGRACYICGRKKERKKGREGGRREESGEIQVHTCIYYDCMIEKTAPTALKCILYASVTRYMYIHD